MAAPLGNKNAAGNHNGKSGRPSAYQEKANAEWLAEAFFKKHTEEELLALAEEKSVSSRMVQDALSGNKDYILALFKKLFPDLSKQEVEVEMDVTNYLKKPK